MPAADDLRRLHHAPPILPLPNAWEPTIARVREHSLGPALGPVQRLAGELRPTGEFDLTDPYSAGWCTLFKFESRVGASVLCPNAMRLLRIR
jgi:hypothetical protein